MAINIEKIKGFSQRKQLITKLSVYKIIKFMLAQTTHSQFRSYKYRLARSKSIQQKTPCNQESTLHSIFPSATARQQKLRSRKKISPFSTTMGDHNSNPQLIGYKKSVNAGSQLQKSSEKQPDDTQQNNKLNKLFSRVQLPHLNEGDSYFSVLDNINLPINYIKAEIVKLKEGLSQEIPKMQQIASDMRQFQKNQLKELEEIQRNGLAGFVKLRKMLNKDRAAYQDSCLRVKRSFTECTEYLPHYCQSLDKTKERLTSLQKTIFSNTPFDLNLRQQSQEGNDQIIYF